MDVVFKGRRTGVRERFRRQATVKLAKLSRLDPKLTRVDVEVTKERNPRLAGRRERVELTIRHGGPAIRAEAAADDRYVALDLALAKLDARVRRANDRKNLHRCDHASVRLMEPDAAALAVAGAPAGSNAARNGGTRGRAARGRAAWDAAAWDAAAPDAAAPQAAAAVPEESDRHAGTEGSGQAPDGLVPIDMDGDGPLVVREKYHSAAPMTIDQALQQMELVGHDFFLFRDLDCGHPSVVYRRRGYDYGVIRLVDV